MKRYRARIEKLEQRWPVRSLPPYLSVVTEANIPAALAELGPGSGFVKLYVGISPDDWDTDNETPQGEN